MKYEVKYARGGDVRWPGTSRLKFEGRGVVHLYETGMVLEGSLPRFTIPLIARFYTPLLCAPTSRTIPYSRVVSHRYSGHWIVFSWARLILMLFFGLLPVAGTIAVSRAWDSTSPVILTALWGLSAVIAIPAAFSGRRTLTLTYRLPNGRRHRVAFRLRPARRAASAALYAQLRQYVTAAACFRRNQESKESESCRA